MSETTDVLIESLCKAAFLPQQTIVINTIGQSVLTEMPSPLMQTLANLMQKAYSENETVRELILAEMTKPENIVTLAGEISKGVARMRVNTSHYGASVEVPEWIREALTNVLYEWLNTEDADRLIPQMLERSTIKITVERKDANDKK